MNESSYLLTNHHGVTYPSQPNYVAFMAGDRQGCSGDDQLYSEADNLVTRLEDKGKTWKGYMEDYEPADDGDCDLSQSQNNLYYRKHNPFFGFNTITQNYSRCQKVVSMDQFYEDVVNDDLPDFAFLTPNINNDGHDQDLDWSGSFLMNLIDTWIRPYSDTWDDVLIFVTSQSENDDKTGTNNVAAFFITLDDHKYLRYPGSDFGTNPPKTNHYALTKLVIENFCLGQYLGNYSRTANAALIPDQSSYSLAAKRSLLQDSVNGAQCTWSVPTTADYLLQCGDGTYCDAEYDWSCCNDHGYRAQCPQNMPIMCNHPNACSGGLDYCCRDDCSQYGGERPCEYEEAESSYVETTGFCRGGTQYWNTGTIWDCSAGYTTQERCQAVCDATDGCGAYDRLEGEYQECCIFKSGNAGNGDSGRICYVKMGSSDSEADPVYPTNYPASYPTNYPTSYPTGPTQQASYPTGYPTAYPTAYPTPYPSTSYPTTSPPSSPPSSPPTYPPTYPPSYPTFADDENWYRWDSNVGGWGGICICPNGRYYEVGDNHDDCGSLACVGGIASACIEGGISEARAGWKVTCASSPTEYPSPLNPTNNPTSYPTDYPTDYPTLTGTPTVSPTASPVAGEQCDMDYDFTIYDRR